MTINHITNHQAQMLARLLFQYKDKPNITKIITTLAARYQGMEDALWQLATQRSIETGEGAQLDVIGRIIGQERGTSADDAEYRLRLRARMRANQSSGTVEDILAVFAALLQSSSAVELTQLFPAALLLRIDDIPVTEDLSTLYASFLGDSVVGGVQAHLQSSPTNTANTFAFPVSTRATVLYESGKATIHVESTAGFAASGYVVFKAGDTRQARVSYAFKTATTFDGCDFREGSTDDLNPGDMVIQFTNPQSELSDEYDALSDIKINVVSAADFPESGCVAVGPLLGGSYRLVRYAAKSSDALLSLTDTGIGGTTSFVTTQIVSLVHKNFGADAEDLGPIGQFSRVVEA